MNVPGVRIFGLIELRSILKLDGLNSKRFFLIDFRDSLRRETPKVEKVSQGSIHQEAKKKKTEILFIDIANNSL